MRWSAASAGSARSILTCAYHGWTYHLDGRNRSVSAPDTFAKFDRSKFGLKPIELEVFSGIRVRQVPRQASRASPSAWSRTRRSSRTTGSRDGAARRHVGARRRHRLEEPGRELRRGLPLPDGPSRALGVDGVAVRSRGPAGRHDAPESPHAREAAQVVERRALREIPADHGASAGGHAPPLDVSRAVPERVLRHLSGVAGFLPGRAARAGAHAHSRAFLWLRGRSSGDEGGSLAVHASECACSGGRRSAHGAQCSRASRRARTRAEFSRTRKSCWQAFRTGSGRGCR